ncbi:MAG: peptidylprolyl isomerase [Rhodobacteraceae bacterium]|nr:peptidylprolyl isomerase [Paracoccaceae bacterium]
MVDIKEPENMILMGLKDGTATIEPLPNVAPQHTELTKTLAAGAYDSVYFHWVIDGFMGQTTDVQHSHMEDGFNIRMAGTCGSEHPDLPPEFSKPTHDRGTLGAARSASTDSMNSQLFIHMKHSHFLNGQSTVVGRVIDGVDHGQDDQR